MYRENLRIDKNVAFNIIEFQKFEDKQTQIIIKSLLIYFSYSYQTDLFGYGALDPYDFANKMNIDKDTLFRRHQNPKQVEDSSLSEKKLYSMEKENGRFSKYRIWDNYLENALYILSSSPLFENYKGSTDKHDFIGIKNYILIKDIRIYVAKTNKGRNKKLMYKYQLDDTFERNLRRFFLQTNFGNYLACKKKNIDDFYLTVSNIYHTYKKQGINKYHWKLNDVLEYFSISKNLEIKYQKRNLNRHFRNLEKIMSNEIRGIKFGWEAGSGQRWKYVPYMTWDMIDIKIAKNEDYKVLDSIFYKHLKRNLYEIYTTQNIKNKNDVRSFYSWLQNEETDEIKVACYISTYSLNKKVESFPKPKTLANSFFSNDIKKCKTTEEIDKCFEIHK